MRFKSFLLVLMMLVSCTDKVPTSGADDANQRSILSDAQVQDIHIIQIPDVTVDAWVDPCLDLQNTDEMYCQCNPLCCQEQTWYCPPRGTEILAKYAILDICGPDLEPCDRSQDPNCPPAEIIYESPCNHAFDCPPGINEDFIMYYNCEIEGVSGIQEVRCDKGRLFYGECITCEESEEVCDQIDNDCDGTIDENQRNACDLCGAVPEEICDGNDNDCDGAVDEELVRECDTICESGLEVCDSGNWIGCTAQRPFPEQCDGADSDCDGLVDEGLNCQCPPEMVGSLMPCMEAPLTCGMGFRTCECANEECDTTQMTECFAICHWFLRSVEGHVIVFCARSEGVFLEAWLCLRFGNMTRSLVTWLGPEIPLQTHRAKTFRSLWALSVGSPTSCKRPLTLFSSWPPRGQHSLMPTQQSTSWGRRTG